MKTVLYLMLILVAAVAWARAQNSFWNPTSGPEGGMVITVTSDDDSVVYAGTSYGGVYRSLNNGTSWSKLPLDVTGTVVTAILPGSNGLILVGTQDQGIFRSTDSGLSWAASNSGLSPYVEAIAQDTKGRLYVCTQGGLYSSFDAGMSWQTVGSAVCIRLAIIADTTIVIGTGSGIIITTDGGLTWGAFDEGLKGGIVWSISVDSSGGIIIGTAYGIYRRLLGDSAWKPVSPAVPGGDETTCYTTSTCVSASGAVYASLKFWGTYRSTDLGQSWVLADTGLSAGAGNLPANWVNILHATKNGTIYAGVEGGGVFRLKKGSPTWEHCTTGLRNSGVNRLATLSDGSILAGTNGNGLFATTDGGQSWNPLIQGIAVNNVVGITESPGGSLFACTPYAVYRLTKGGAGWEAVQSGISAYDALYDIRSSPSGTVFLGAWSGIYRSTDAGDHWQQPDIQVPEPYNKTVSSIAIDSNGTIFAGTDKGVSCSTDDGLTWTMRGAAELGGFTVHALSVGPNQTVYAGSDFLGLFRSSDTGKTWTSIANGLPSAPVRCLAVNRLGFIYAGLFDYDPIYGKGVFCSRDNGLHWTEIGSGLGGNNVQSLAIDNSGYLFAGTEGNGVYRSSDATTGAVISRSPIPTQTGLSQNYPNPFNSSTVISYDLARESHVKILVFDVLGRLVRRLVDEQKPPGSYRILFDAGTLPSGVYFCQLQTRESVATRKLVLMK